MGRIGSCLGSDGFRFIIDITTIYLNPVSFFLSAALPFLFILGSRLLAITNLSSLPLPSSVFHFMFSL